MRRMGQTEWTTWVSGPKKKILLAIIKCEYAFEGVLNLNTDSVLVVDVNKMLIQTVGCQSSTRESVVVQLNTQRSM